MHTYGIKVYNTAGEFALLTPKMAKIIAGGYLTMPNSLNGDNTYGTDISLSPFTNVPREDIGVIVQPSKVNWKATIGCFQNGGSYPFGWYAKDGVAYYTKSDVTGVMSAWSAGAMVVNNINTWDGMCNCFPLAGWDFLDAQTTFNNVRIWAAMTHIVYDYSASQWLAVHTIGNQGVEEVNYMVFLKNR
jgi:hypothetical protein